MNATIKTTARVVQFVVILALAIVVNVVSYKVLVAEGFRRHAPLNAWEYTCQNLAPVAQIVMKPHELYATRLPGRVENFWWLFSGVIVVTEAMAIHAVASRVWLRAD